MSTQIQGCAPSLTHARAPTSSGACLRAKHRPLQALGSHSPPGSPVRQHCDDRPPNREEGPRRMSARPHTCTLARAAVLTRAVPRMLPPRSTSSPPAGTHKRRAGPQGGLRANGSLMTGFFILLPPPPRSAYSFLRDLPRHLGLKSTVLPLSGAPSSSGKAVWVDPGPWGGAGAGAVGEQPCLRKRGALQLSPGNSSGSEKWSFHGRSRERH